MSESLKNESQVNVQVHQRLIQVFEDIFEVKLDPGREDVTREDIEGWDSMSHLRLMLEVEQVFGLEITDEEMVTLASLKDIQATLDQRGITMAADA